MGFLSEDGLCSFHVIHLGDVATELATRRITFTVKPNHMNGQKVIVVVPEWQKRVSSA